MKGLPSVRQLRAFVAVYHSGHVSAAAEQLALTQPAVTVLLRELEDKLGVKLFDRTTRTLRRTDAAAEAIAYAERALAELAALEASMGELSGIRRGRVRIVATSTMAQTLLPKAVRRFLELHPGVAVAIEDCAPGEFVQILLGERADVGVGTLEAPVAGLVEQVFLHDRLNAVALPGPAFAGGRPITWKQLAALPLITVKPGYGVRRRIDRGAQEAGVALRIVHEVSLLTTAVAMAANGLGVAVVPGTLLSLTPYAELVARPLVRPAVQRNTALIYRHDRSLSPPARAFAELLAREFSGG
jgi:DNA-binding transcriptional LysR family regulator